MACCIFVAFLVSQLFAFFELIGLRSSARGDTRRAAEQNWRLGDAPMAAAVASPGRNYGGEGRPLPRWATAAVIGAEVGLLAAAAAWLFLLGGASAMAAEITQLSQADSLADFLALCGF